MVVSQSSRAGVHGVTLHSAQAQTEIFKKKAGRGEDIETRNLLKSQIKVQVTPTLPSLGYTL